MERAGLGGVRAVKSPPAPTTISHGVLIGWSAARAEHRNLPWKSARELALDPARWAVPMRRERGFVQELPDLAVWIPRYEAPGAVIAEHGGRREDRQKMILEGWRDAVRSGQYTAVRYDCASPSVAYWIGRLARKVGLTDREFVAYEQTTAEHIAAMPSAVPDDEPATNPAEPSEEREPTPEQQAETTAPAPAPTARATVEIRPPIPPPPEPETPEVAAERRRRSREILGIDEPQPRRRWRR